MSPEERETWLQANTFECPHGMGRIPPSQCEAYRARPTIREVKGDWNLYRHRQTPVMPEACEGCREWKGKEVKRVHGSRFTVGEEEGEVKKEIGKKRKEKNKKRKVRVCLKCGEEKTILARGMCGACYQRSRKTGKYPKPRGRGGRLTPEAGDREKGEKRDVGGQRLEAGKHKEGEGEDMAKIKKEEEGIWLDFSEHPDLLEQLRKRAEEQVRGLEQQILWELKTYSFEPALVEKELAWRLYGLAKETKQRQQEALKESR